MDQQSIVEELDDTIEQLEQIAERQLGSKRKEALATAVMHLNSLREALRPPSVE